MAGGGANFVSENNIKMLGATLMAGSLDMNSRKDILIGASTEWNNTNYGESFHSYNQTSTSSNLFISGDININTGGSFSLVSGQNISDNHSVTKTDGGLFGKDKTEVIDSYKLTNISSNITSLTGNDLNLAVISSQNNLQINTNTLTFSNVNTYSNFFNEGISIGVTINPLTPSEQSTHPTGSIGINNGYDNAQGLAIATIGEGGTINTTFDISNLNREKNNMIITTSHESDQIDIKLDNISLQAITDPEGYVSTLIDSVNNLYNYNHNTNNEIINQTLKEVEEHNKNNPNDPIPNNIAEQIKNFNYLKGGTAQGGAIIVFLC